MSEGETFELSVKCFFISSRASCFVEKSSLSITSTALGPIKRLPSTQGMMPPPFECPLLSLKRFGMAELVFCKPFSFLSRIASVPLRACIEKNLSPARPATLSAQTPAAFIRSFVRQVPRLVISSVIVLPSFLMPIRAVLKKNSTPFSQAFSA